MVFNGCKVFCKMLSFYLQSPLPSSLSGWEWIEGSPQLFSQPCSWHWAQGCCQHIQTPQCPAPRTRCLNVSEQTKWQTKKSPRGLSWSHLFNCFPDSGIKPSPEGSSASLTSNYTVCSAPSPMWIPQGWPACSPHQPTLTLATWGTASFLCHRWALLGFDIFKVQVALDPRSTLLLNWFADCATLNMIQEKLPELPLHLSLEMVFVLRSFASDTPSPQLPQLFYLYLSGTLKGKQQITPLFKWLVQLN